MLSLFPRSVLDEILNLIESVSEDFPSYSLVRFTAHVFRERLSICCVLLSILVFDGGAWDLIALIPDHSLSIFFTESR